MKTIDLSSTTPTLAEVLQAADQENVLLKTQEGREFVLAEIDDLAREIELIRQNEELMQLLDERSKETKRYTLDEVNAMLSDPNEP